MSFTKTISTIAALASIFGAAAAGWKLAESNSQTPPTALDEKINQLDQKLEELAKPAPVVLPEQPLTVAPQPATLPPVAPPPPPPVTTETQP